MAFRGPPKDPTRPAGRAAAPTARYTKRQARPGSGAQESSRAKVFRVDPGYIARPDPDPAPRSSETEPEHPAASARATRPGLSRLVLATTGQGFSSSGPRPEQLDCASSARRARAQFGLAMPGHCLWTSSWPLQTAPPAADGVATSGCSFKKRWVWGTELAGGCAGLTNWAGLRLVEQ